MIADLWFLASHGSDVPRCYDWNVLNVSCKTGLYWQLLLDCWLLLIQCGEPFKEEDMIVINGPKEEVEILKHKMLERREKAKSKVCLTSELSDLSDFWFLQSRLKNIDVLFQKSKKSKAAKAASAASEAKGVCEASLTTVTLSYYLNLFSISINSVRPPTHLLLLLDAFEYTEVSCRCIQASGTNPEITCRRWEIVLIWVYNTQ